MEHQLLRIASELILPPFGPFLLLLAGFILHALQWRRTGIVLASLATLFLFTVSLVAIDNRVRAPWPQLPDRIAPPYPSAEAIVVLGAGRYLQAPEYGGDTAAAGSLERVRYAARLHRETGRPVLVSGGRPGGLGDRSEAEIMRDILEQEFRIPVRWVESQSEDTLQNAAYSASLLRRDGIERIYLVTHGFHMRRAAEAFGAHAIEVVPMITGFQRPVPESTLSWTPSFEGLTRNRGWLYEMLANLRP